MSGIVHLLQKLSANLQEDRIGQRIGWININKTLTS